MEFPQINGYQYSWASIEISLGKTGEGQSITTLIKSIDYGNSRKRGMGRGASGRKSLRTKGSDEPSASITFYRPAFDELVQRWGDGFQDVEFDITVSYADVGQPTVTDKVERALIDDWSIKGDDGSDDPVTVECKLDVMDVLINGKRGRALPT